MRRWISPIVVLLAAWSGSAAAATLLDAEVGDRVEIAPFRYAADKAFLTPLTLKRIDVYAAQARVLVIDELGQRELPRSTLRFYITDKAQVGSRMFLAVDPQTQAVSGGILDSDGTLAIEGRLLGAAALAVDSSQSLPREAEAFSCGGGLPGAGRAMNAPMQSAESGLFKAAADAAGKAASRTAVVAVDTDNELLQRIFSDNTVNATNYLATLFASMNTMYERDLDITLLQGDVFLRVSTTPDPYPTTESSGTSAQLSEFAEHWRLNQTTVQRAFAMQISGKSSSGCSSAGVAWLLNQSGQNYCTAKGNRINGNTATFGHYSISRVFNGVGGCGSIAGNATFSAGLVGHELGHNFGARHTHCTAANGSSPTADVSTGTIDACFNGDADGGCYGGPVSCPTEPFLGVTGQGTVMSYCNFSPPSGASCDPNGGQVLRVFHPVHQTFLAQRIQTNVSNGCLATDSSGGSNLGPTLSAASPASGSTTAMAGGAAGAQVSSNIVFSASGGSGNGTTALSCSVAAGTVQIASGSPQSVVVGGSVAPVVARFTLSGASQQGTITCTATPQGGSTANFTYNFTAPPASGPAPANNDFANATTITGSSATLSGSNVGASKQAGEPAHAGNSGGVSVWWQWTAPASGSATLSTAGSSFDTLLAVYTGAAVNALSVVAQNDDTNQAANVLTSNVAWTASAGTTYRIAVDGFNAAAGSITLQISGPAPIVECPTCRVFQSGFEAGDASARTPVR